MQKDDIHTFFRYSIPGYFFIFLIVIFVVLFPEDFYKNEPIIKHVLNNPIINYLMTPIIGFVTGILGSYLFGFVFHSLHSFWYKWRYFQYKWKISEQKMAFVEIIKSREPNGKKLDYTSVRALHDFVLFNKENENITERMMFISTKFYLYSSLIVSILIFWALEFIIFLDAVFSNYFIIIFNIIVLILGILFWQERRTNFSLLEAIEKKFIKSYYDKK